MNEFSHFDAHGRARMVDVSHKPDQKRVARALGKVQLSPETLRQINEGLLPKGDPFETVRIAGIQAAKRTSELIPLCHPLAITQVDIDLSISDQGVEIQSKVVCVGPTGAEMEALTAVSVAALTLYDMCKAVDSKIVIGPIWLMEKTKEII
ncbi:MAG TPA: cyclic pyranopterin monophosphate synthase MoaC [Acidobacteriota bacterium]